MCPSGGGGAPLSSGLTPLPSLALPLALAFSLLYSEVIPESPLRPEELRFDNAYLDAKTARNTRGQLKASLLCHFVCCAVFEVMNMNQIAQLAMATSDTRDREGEGVVALRPTSADSFWC